MPAPGTVAFVFLGRPQVSIFRGWFDPDAGQSENIRPSAKSNQGPSDLQASALTATPCDT